MTQQEQISKQNLKKWVGKNLQENTFIIVFLLLLSSLSFYIWFEWPKWDQTLHVPMIYQLIDDSLYSRDYFSTFTSQKYAASNFHYFMAAISTPDNLFYMFLSLTFILNVIFLFSIFLLAKQISNNTNIALLTTVIFSIFRLSLQAVEISATILLPRTFILAFLPLIIYLYIQNIQNYSKIRALVVFALLGLFYNIHPVSALPIIIVTLGTEIFYFKRLDGMYFGLLIFVLTLPANLHYLTAFSTIPRGETLLNMIKIRTPHNIFDYEIKTLFTTFIYAPILALIAYYMKHRDRTEIDKILISWVMFFCFFSFISLLITTFVRPTFIFYMLTRVWKYGYLISIIYAVLLASLLWKRKNKNKTRLIRLPLSKIAAILIIMFLLGSVYSPNVEKEKLTPVHIAKSYTVNSLQPALKLLSYDKPIGRRYYDSFVASDNKYLNLICKSFIEPSKKNQELREIGDWLKKNTDKDVLIMPYPPDFERLRTYSQRSTLVTHDDGFIATFSEEVFQKWWSLYNEVKGGDPVVVANKYDVDYILTNSSINLHLEKVYYTEHFNLYRTR